LEGVKMAQEVVSYWNFSFWWLINWQNLDSLDLVEGQVISNWMA
jgi:hypothetical protein